MVSPSSLRRTTKTSRAGPETAKWCVTVASLAPARSGKTTRSVAFFTPAAIGMGVRVSGSALARGASAAAVRGGELVPFWAWAATGALRLAEQRAKTSRPACGRPT